MEAVIGIRTKDDNDKILITYSYIPAGQDSTEGEFTRWVWSLVITDLIHPSLCNLTI